MNLFIYLKLSVYTCKTVGGRHKHTNIHESNTPRLMALTGVDAQNKNNRDLRSFEIRFDFESNFRFEIRFVVMIRFEIFESSAPSIDLCKETIGGG